MIKQKFRKKPVVIEAYQTDKELEIETLEGTMHASIGDRIITGVNGEPYPCKPNILKKTYEPVVEVKDVVATTMTREEASLFLKDLVDVIDYQESENDDYLNARQALKMAIEALEQIESGRYVKGECSICSKECGTLGCCTTVSNHWVYSCKEGMTQYAEALKQESKCGEWIGVDCYDAFGGDETIWAAHGNPIAFHYCSNCKEQAYAGEDGQSLLTKYCPNCGARMESDEE